MRWFCTGLLLGGASTGALALLVGSILRAVLPVQARPWLLAGAAASLAGAELGWYRLPLPQNRRQVPTWIIREGNRTGALQFGYEMGTGLRTFMPSGLPHLALLAVLLLGGWWPALAGGASFGAGRAAMTMARYWHGDPDRWDARLVASASAVSRLLLTGVALGVVALLTAAVGRP